MVISIIQFTYMSVMSAEKEKKISSLGKFAKMKQHVQTEILSSLQFCLSQFMCRAIARLITNYL